MAVRTILHYPNKQLSTQAAPVVSPSEATQEDETYLVSLIQDLKDTATAFGAQGLAASQIGEHVQVFVTKMGDTYKVFINPDYVPAGTQQIFADEGCLSFPGVRAKVSRHTSIHASYQNEDGEEITETFHGADAVAYQHELDHLAGILFTERMKPLQRRMALKRHTKLYKRHQRNMKTVKTMSLSELRSFAQDTKEALSGE